MALCGAVVGGCGEEAGPVQTRAPFGQQTRPELTAPEAAHAFSARRCGECHEKAARTWEASAHARSDQSATYRAMRQASGRDDCDRCHAPLRALPSVDPSIAAEGVTCDVCHTIRTVTPDPHGAALALEIPSAVRYGPLCDARDHYFHRMGCSPFHSRSELCGGCHLWTTHTAGLGELDVLSTYAEWQASPQAAEELHCQSCHMQASRGEVATGWGTRASASDHGLFGAEQAVRQYALELELGVEANGDQLRLGLAVINAGAAHALPTGLPARRLIAEVTTLGAHGEQLERQQRVYGRVLVDERGAEAPFYAAQRVESDTRLAAGERRHEAFTLASSGVVQVRVEVYAHAMSAAIAQALGVTPPSPIRLAEASSRRDSRGQWPDQSQGRGEVNPR